MPDHHILVVDDNADARETLAAVLELAGYDVATAENGRAALDLAARSRPALVLLDLMMPMMDGWQVVEAMRIDPDLSSVPVVIVSAATSPPPRGVPILRKPAGMDELLALVRRTVSGVASAPS